jgi:hypothetical protein
MKNPNVNPNDSKLTTVPDASARRLRSREIAILFFRDARNPQASADGLLKTLCEKQLVIYRTLPERGGRAVLLSERGAALLREEGVEAKSGQNWRRWLEAEGTTKTDKPLSGLTQGLILVAGKEFVPGV